MQPSPYPDEAVAGPVVALTNEHAGSDGDIFSHTFKLMELGPLVGKRTWGGVIGIWPRHALVDGTRDDAARVLVLVRATSAWAWRTTAPIPTSRSTTRRRTHAAGATASSRCRSRPRSTWSRATA